MRHCWPLLAFSLALLLCPSAQAQATDQPQQALSLRDYRVKAALPAVCSQLGGTIVYGTNAHDCKLPTVTSKIPSSGSAAGHALPMTVRH